MRQIIMNVRGAMTPLMPAPTIGAGEVLVRVKHSAVSVGTELAPLLGTNNNSENTYSKIRKKAGTGLYYAQKAVRHPDKAAKKIKSIIARSLQAGGTMPIGEEQQQGWNVGYSAAGEVVAVGEGVTEFVPGKAVACAGAGWANHAEYICVPRNLVCAIPESVTTRQAAFATIASIALQGVRRASPQLGEVVLVVGLGLIGQLTSQMLIANGCRVLGFEVDDSRCARAPDGVQAVSDEDELYNLIEDSTSGHGVDAVIVCAATSSDAPLNLAFKASRRRGRVVIVGDVGLTAERSMFYKKEIDLLMSTSYGPGRYDSNYERDGTDYPYAFVRWTVNRNLQMCLQMMADGKLNLEPLIDDEVTIEDAPAAYARLVDAVDSRPMGMLIGYEPKTEPRPLHRLDIAKPAPKGEFSFALAGLGAFGISTLLPILKDNNGRLKAVVSEDQVRGSNFARDNRVDAVATSIDAVLDSDTLDAVVIANRHNRHADQVCRALAKNKHVFVEKPLALTWSELDSVSAAYKYARPDTVLMVGFNRRFSPAATVIKAAIEGRRSPLMINYRLNGGRIPLDHWVQGDEGGGRNIGEACHIYDLFRFFTGASPVAIHADAIDPVGKSFLRNDNFVATIRYADGSLAVLTYSSLGPSNGLAKEYAEVFVDGDAYVLDDYHRVTRASDSHVLWEAKQSDKGHRAELSRFADAVKGKAEAPIPADQLIETSAVALAIEDLIHGRSLADHLNDV